MTKDPAATILLVEDDPGVRRLATTQLERGGYMVLAAGSGSEALELLSTRGGSIDLLISDVVMPRMSGPDLARKVSANQPGVPVLFLSGYAEQSGGGLSLHELGIEGKAAFLSKPFTAEALITAVRSALQLGRGGRGGARRRSRSDTSTVT